MQCALCRVTYRSRSHLRLRVLCSVATQAVVLSLVRRGSSPDVRNLIGDARRSSFFGRPSFVVTDMHLGWCGGESSHHARCECITSCSIDLPRCICRGARNWEACECSYVIIIITSVVLRSQRAEHKERSTCRVKSTHFHTGARSLNNPSGGPILEKR